MFFPFILSFLHFLFVWSSFFLAFSFCVEPYSILYFHFTLKLTLSCVPILIKPSSLSHFHFSSKLPFLHFHFVWSFVARAFPICNSFFANMHLLLTTMPLMIFSPISVKMLLLLAIPPSLISFFENAIYFLSFDFMFFYCLYFIPFIC
jgi:hypothetical protein